MSWKGFQKAMSRLPHQILSKKGDVTKDPEFMALEARFNETTKIAETLKAEGQNFRDSVAALLTHQAEMASFLAIIYSHQIGAETEHSEVQKRVQPTSAESLQAVNDAEAAMAYCRDEILPELDSIDRFVIRPSLELQEIIKTIQKTIVKRNHKLVDYDRHRIALQKLNAKTERTLNDEKSIFKVQSQLDTATQDYDYLNNGLKEQLPTFFQLLFELMQPIMESLYQLQSKIYGMIYARCYELIHANEEYFVTHTMDIEAGYQWRKQQHDVQAEIESLDLLRSKTWLSVSGGENSSKLTIQERASLKKNTEPTTAGGLVQTRAPPPPPPSKKPNIQYVTALYDYDAQAEGDLSFRKDDKIELVERTADTNDWWTGKLNGMTGVFPGNYVTE